MARTFQFGGEGNPTPGTFLNWFKLVSLYTPGGTVHNDNNNSEAAFDFRYRMDWLWDAQLYGEWGGEDTGFKPRLRSFSQDIGYILGLYLPRITPDGRTDLRLEYTDNVNEQVGRVPESTSGTPTALYTSGMTYKGSFWGTPWGPMRGRVFCV